MFGKTTLVAYAVFAVVLNVPAALSQRTPIASGSPVGLELPVTLRQNVAAGTTPVGTRIQAVLVMATMVDSVVVPQGAILSGEVTESVAKSKTEPSRLAIRVDSAQWKNGSAPLKVYLTSWYYPLPAITPPDMDFWSTSYDRRQGDWNRSGTNLDPRGQASQPFPDINDINKERDASKNNSKEKDADPAAPSSPSSTLKHRVVMKNVDSERNHDGGVTLSSKRLNIKLDKLTTYVLGTDNLLPRN